MKRQVDPVFAANNGVPYYMILRTKNQRTGSKLEAGSTDENPSSITIGNKLTVLPTKKEGNFEG